MNMTNEEKSNEIAQQSDFTTNARDIDIAFKAAMKMAEWKDKQAKEIFCKVSCNYPQEKTHLCVKYGGCNKYRMFVNKLKGDNDD